MAFAENLKHLMDIEGLSNYKLAKILGCHQTTVQNWLDGSIPQKRTQSSIANVFGITISELMGNNLPLPNNKNKPTPEDEPMSLDALRALSKEELYELMNNVVKALKEKE